MKAIINLSLSLEGDAQIQNKSAIAALLIAIIDPSELVILELCIFWNSICTYSRRRVVHCCKLVYYVCLSPRDALFGWKHVQHDLQHWKQCWSDYYCSSDYGEGEGLS